MSYEREGERFLEPTVQIDFDCHRTRNEGETNRRKKEKNINLVKKLIKYQVSVLSINNMIANVLRS
jgi:hypothetical protein